MFKNILFALDIEDQYLDDSLPKVIQLAEMYDARLTIISVGQGYMLERYLPSKLLKKINSEMEVKLKKIIEKYPSNKPINTCLEQGNIYESIIETSKKIEADLIILTASRPELKEYLLGPNAAKVVRHADISVLVLRNY